MSTSSDGYLKWWVVFTAGKHVKPLAIHLWKFAENNKSSYQKLFIYVVVWWKLEIDLRNFVSIVGRFSICFLIKSAFNKIKTFQHLLLLSPVERLNGMPWQNDNDRPKEPEHVINHKFHWNRKIKEMEDEEEKLKKKQKH